ncbi:amidohydrolase [Chryseobacterium sp. 2TAF14]|uniref:amidohydrolase n=1 Tax=Chryseobacterium sp. 2TAF14 TaxID=3233007 RepID=UPI003F924587
MKEESHNHGHMCFCACTNPAVTLLKEDLFGSENIALMTASLPKNKPEVVQPAPIVFTGGIIRPMIDGKTDMVEAIAFAEGRVVANGSFSYVTTEMDIHYKGQYTIRNLDPKQTLLPGLFEPHIHVVFSGLMASFVDVGPFDKQNIRKSYDKNWVKETLKANLPQESEDAVLLANGLDPALLTPYSKENFKNIDYKFLNDVSTTIPIMVISASGHTVYINSAAIVKVYKQNEAALKADGYCTQEEFEKQGRGLLQEEKGLLYAFSTFKSQIINLANDNMSDNLDAFFAEANSRGVTSMYDAILNDEYLKYLNPYVDSKVLSVRLGGARYCESAAALPQLPPYEATEDYSDLYFGHVKVVSDGSNQGLTGYQSEDYACPPDTNKAGIFDFKPQDTYPALIKSIMIDKGWPIMIHANGDKAVTLTIDAYREAFKLYVGTPLRNRIEHCSLFSDRKQLDEMAELGISPSFLIGHVGYWGFAFKDIIFKGQKLGGYDKVDMLDLCKSALDKKLRISLHSDHTVTPIGPLRMMEQSITRVMEARPPEYDFSPVLNKTECLSPEEALRAATYDAAWQCYAEKWAGSLPKGHFADFIILAEDPLSMPHDKISMNMRNITVQETWLGGHIVYRHLPIQ